ncbi:MAG: AAA family ATPase [Candidatus Doudnabacteria bacterium]|nr:AAA family ATPase [Candidatus Doudnabacteria bacterium]
MDQRNAEALPIKGKDLAEYNSRANDLLKKVTFTPRVSLDPGVKPIPGQMAWKASPTVAPEAKEVSIFGLAHAIDPESTLILPDNVNHAVSIVWQGLRIGAYLRKLYEQASNLEVLVGQNQRGVLESAQKTEFREKYTTASAISLFVTAYYIAWELSRSDGGDSKAEINGVPEVNLQNPIDAVNCMMYYYGAYLTRPEIVQNADDFVKVTRLYFKAVADEIKSRASSLKYTEPFTARLYKLDKSEFAINGFTVDLAGSQMNVEFNRVEIGDIVGNRAAKRQAVLLAQRLMCYDFEKKKNPMQKLGGLPKLRMGDGPPGTGKSMLIAAVATLLSDYCTALKYPFAFRPLPDNIVSTFQGGTAERAVEWFVGFNDPSRIWYGTIDDGEVNLEDRTRNNVSAGVREFIGVFLRRTEGAYAVNHGNFVIDIYTNLPDQIDKAVLSRIVSRFLIAGAETPEDFIDQDFLWWKKYREMDPKFVDMADDPTYEYLIQQKMLKTLSETAVRHSEPQDERLRRIFRQVCEKSDPRQNRFLGELFAAVRAEFPFFTSRDVRNIQQAVDGRILDFDLPTEWIDHPDQFYFRSYDEKLAILTDRMRNNMTGLKFSEVRLQETVMYLDQMVRLAEVTRQRTIDEGVDRSVMGFEIGHRLEQLKASGRLKHLSGVN